MKIDLHTHILPHNLAARWSTVTSCGGFIQLEHHAPGSPGSHGRSIGRLSARSRTTAGTRNAVCKNCARYDVYRPGAFDRAGHVLLLGQPGRHVRPLRLLNDHLADVGAGRIPRRFAGLGTLATSSGARPRDSSELVASVGDLGPAASRSAAMSSSGSWTTGVDPGVRTAADAAWERPCSSIRGGHARPRGMGNAGIAPGWSACRRNGSAAIWLDSWRRAGRAAAAYASPSPTAAARSLGPSAARIEHGYGFDRTCIAVNDASITAVSRQVFPVDSLVHDAAALRCLTGPVGGQPFGVGLSRSPGAAEPAPFRRIVERTQSRAARSVDRAAHASPGS